MAPKRNIAEKYVKLNPEEHVLHRPGMYIGSIDKDNVDTWILNEDGSRMIKKTIEYIPGLFKIFDEIVANATDHAIRLGETDSSNKVKNIKIEVNKDTGIISVFNDGEGIEIAEHPQHKMYIPQLIFGNLLTSTNYDDTEDRLVQGTNGIGCKACNVFSKWFEVETVDHTSQKIYIQKWEKNMTVTGKPSIRKSAKKPYTIVRFLPDYEKFGLGKLSSDMYEIMRKRAYDACAVTTKDINIWFNGDKLNYKDFEKYANLYLGDNTRVYEKIDDRWEIIASYNEHCGFEQVSFVNGLLTLKGGRHVDYIVNQIVKRITEMISSTKKEINIRPQNIKDNMIIFIKCTIINPTFDSQSKETLTTLASKFGSTPKVSDVFIKKLLKSGISQKIMELCAISDDKTLKKTDGKKSNVIRGIPKLEDAIWAGTSKSKDCVLILTEGDSAASMAISGISDARDKYGVFPLKGKVMNVKDATIKKIAENDEISNIKKVLGLESGKTYTVQDLAKSLRYGKVMLMTDSDVDGAHIKGLIFNLFHTMWPSLMKSDMKFLTSMLTPIIKAKGPRGKTISFYNLTDYDNWKKSPEGSASGWKIKYYKGLGTSTNQEAKEYFRDMHLVTYNFTGKSSDEAMNLAFNKKLADDRKAWLAKYNKQDILDYKDTEVSYESFINKDLIHFSNYDLNRSLPSMCDGLKISQRKILWSCFKRNLTTEEIRVAQLAGYISEHSAYHHGEASLQAAIIGMAQDFVGSNNINLLMPNGQFGSRVHGGKDAGQPRYIHTLLSPQTSKIFSKLDSGILSYIEDDGIKVEPEFYVPIIPMILVNGAIGIGTGFSTNIPCYNPNEIIEIIKNKLTNKPFVGELIPWYRGFEGKIKKIGEHKYVSIGNYERVGATSIRITELPVGYWTIDFKTDLEKLLDTISEFKNYENKSGEKINILLNFTSSKVVDDLMQVEDNGYTQFENKFNMVSSKGLTTSNMYAFNAKGQITKYNSPMEILNEFYSLRLKYYQKRKDALMISLEHDMNIYNNKIRFVREVVNETLKVHKMHKQELETYLKNNKYFEVNEGYDYITRIPIYNLTKDKVEEFEAEIEKAKQEYNTIKNKTIETMWMDDLNHYR
jgi:DNA topoisomerase-2